MNVLHRIDAIARREHDATVELVEALLVCDRLRAHLDAGYSSLFDLLVRRLRYSNAAAARRIGAMRCARRSPRALELLRARRTSLTVLAKIESTLESCEDPDGLLDAIADRSQTEVESLLAARHPSGRPRERVRKIAVVAPAVPSSPASMLADAPPRTTPSGREVVPNRSAADLTAARVPRASTLPEPKPGVAAPEVRRTISFSVSEADFEAFDRARVELEKNLPRRMSIEESFNALVESFLKRRAVQGARAKPKSAPPRGASVPPTRHVPVSTRRHVLERDEHRCQYVAPDGTRCEQTRSLEIDHIVPFARGGSHDPSNLRVLCRAHNQRTAEREFGPRPRQRE